MDLSSLQNAVSANSMLQKALRAEELSVKPGPMAYTYANTQFEIIKTYVEKFQQSLDDEHDVGLMLTNFGQSMIMNVTHIGYEKSVLMVFRGFVNGTEATLIQHVSQLNFLLMAVPKEPNKPRRKIGFSVDSEE